MSDAMPLNTAHGPVTNEAMVRVATLLNDFNPVHYDLEFERGLGMPGVVAPVTARDRDGNSSREIAIAVITTDRPEARSR